MADINNIDIVDRDISSVNQAIHDVRKKDDRKCKLTEQSYMKIVYKRVDAYKNKSRELAQQSKSVDRELNDKKDSLNILEKEELQSSLIELIELSEMYKSSAKMQYKKAMQLKKSKALRMASSMINSMMKQYDQVVPMIEAEQIDLSDVDVDNIKKVVADNLSDANLSFAVDVNGNDLSDVSSLPEAEVSVDRIVPTESFDSTPIIPPISEYSVDDHSDVPVDNIGMINDRIFANPISEMEGENGMTYESVDSVIANSSSTEDLEQLQEHLRSISKEREELVRLREETLMKEANEARELADARDQTRRAYEEVNKLISGISRDIDKEKENVSQSKGKIEQYTAEKQKEVEKQRRLNEMVGAYSADVQSVSGIGTNFVSIGKGPIR